MTGQSDGELAGLVATALPPPPIKKSRKKASPLGPGRPARPGMAVPAQGPYRRPARGPGQRSNAVAAGPRPAAAARDHSGAGGGAAAQSERADGFTRIDAFDRVGDVPKRLVPLTRER